MPISLRTKIGVASMLGACLAGAIPALAGVSLVDPVSLYGEQIVFDVKRNGTRVGTQTVTFGRTPDQSVKVGVALELAIKFLGITVYRYDYRSDAIWRDGLLIRLKSKQNDDGKINEVRVVSSEDGLRVEGPNGVVVASADLFPTNHWNPGVIGSKQVINTLNGSLAEVTITNEGRETITAQEKAISATKFVYRGDVNPTVWYDDSGRWVKFKFVAEDGSEIVYECRKCGL